MRTGNPTLRPEAFEGFGRASTAGDGVMTLDGTINKTGILLLLAIATASISWRDYFAGGGLYQVYLMGGIVGGLVFALITSFKRHWAPYTAPLYALSEGLFLGAISAQLAATYQAIVIQAVALTFAVMFVMLGLYKARVIKVTAKFRTGVIAATGAVFLVYMITFILGLFGIHVPYIHSGGGIGIALNVAVIGLAALNLTLDFDLVEQMAGRTPKFMEWYAAFALMVTLVWLYIEILRLLSRLNRR